MTKLFLIRHGQSEWNKLSKVQGQKNTKLTELGKRQAQKLGERLIEEKIDMVYTSDLDRAYHTAQIISEIINKPLIAHEGLRELCFGPWEGLTIKEITGKFKEEYNIWLREPHMLKLDGLEDLLTLRKRTMNMVKEIINNNKGKNIGIVSHGVTLKSIMLGLLDMDVSHHKNFSLSNVSLSIVECREYNNVLRLLNDISHLKGL